MIDRRPDLSQAATTMDAKLFRSRSAEALEHIDDVLGDLEHEDLDVQLSADVLTLTFSDGQRFVINAHGAARQVWMAAGTTAWHFDFHEQSGHWVATRTGDELMATLAKVVGEKLQQSIDLS